jgi:anti-anti-sigma regulatory factor
MGQIRQRPMIHEGRMVELSGEFDWKDLRDLRETLDEAGERGAVVDLSEVTFLDLQATRELAVRSQLHAGNLLLKRPSWAVLASIAACGYEPWFDFVAGEAGDGIAAGLPRR